MIGTWIWLRKSATEPGVESQAPGNVAARAGGGAIPVVFVAVADPFEAGLIAGLPRPGGRFTGLSLLTPEPSGKRLELLAQSLGKVSLVAVLWNPDNLANAVFVEQTEIAARKLGLGLRYFDVRKPVDLEPAFEAAVCPLNMPAYTVTGRFWPLSDR
jgi:putative ABC transport system substrate-binding protein